MPARPDPITRGMWFLALAGLSLLPYGLIPWDFAHGAARGMGWIPNVAILFAMVYIVLLNGALRHMRSPGERAVVAFMVLVVSYAAIRTTASPGNPLLSYAGIVAIFGGFGAGIGAYALTRSGTPVLPAIAKWIMVGAVPLLALPLLVYLTADRFAPREWMLNLYGFTNVRALGHYSSIAILVMAGLSMAVLPGDAKSRHGVRGTALALFAFSVAMWSILFWSGSRGGVLAVIAGVSLSCVVLRRARPLEIAYNTGAMTLGALLSLAYWTPHNSYGLLNRVGTTMRKIDEAGSTPGGSTVDAITTGRIDIWRWALGVIAEKPLAGWGYLPMLGMDPDTTPNFAHTHNLILEWALGFGIPVTALGVGVLFWLWIRALLVVRANPTPASLAAFYLATMLPIYSELSAVLISPYQIILFGSVLGGLIGIGVRRTREERGIGDRAGGAGTGPGGDEIADRLFV